MGLSEEGDENVLPRFEEICLDLNMDATAKDEAWQNYQKILANFSLEGDQMHWLACSLYEACRRTSVPTVGRGTMEGNCVSLTRLLRSSKFSLIQFFNKMRKWSDMASLPKVFRDKIDKLERNFAVSTVIFKKFEPIFQDIFVNPAHELPRQPRGRKQRRLPCTSHEVFNFAWTMFAQVKGNFPAISDDLVNSYHLLLCCIDWIFTNAVLGNRRDLLNRDFEGLPEEFLSSHSKTIVEAPCIMQILCEKHDGLVVEAKTIKEHWWKPHIRRLYEKKILKGKVDSLGAILEMGNFEDNVKTINNLYEEYVLGVGDFDERIFLGEDANYEIGTPGNHHSDSDLAEQMQVKRSSLKHQFDENKYLTPATPLTGRRYLKEKDPTSVTPVSTATQSVSRLQSLLSGSKTSPSDDLQEVFKSCSQNPQDGIIQRVKDMGECFCKHYAKSMENQAGAPIDFARKRLQLGESLYYKTLEGILQGERKRISGKDNVDCNVDLLGLLENDNFHRSLLACCLEIVIFSYNSQRMFPWIVDIFELSPYQFYKVIEIIIRAEKELSRDVVKHLNHIEESILESYAWRSDSPIWEAIKDQCVPNTEEVMPWNHIESKDQSTNTAPVVKHPRLRSLVGDIRTVIQKGIEQVTSPVAPLASDRFSSPTPGNAKRRLFGTRPSVTTLPFTPNSTAAGTAPVITVVSSSDIVSPPPPQEIVQVQRKSILLATEGTSDALIVSNKVASTLAPTSITPVSKPSFLPMTSTAATTIITPTIGSGTGNGTSIQSCETSNPGPTTTSVVAAASGSGSIPTSSIQKSSGGATQQAIVAMMEDGRQILIPVQIAQPSSTSTASTSTMADSITAATTKTSTNTNPVGKKPPAFFQVHVKLDGNAKSDQKSDHNYIRPKKTGSLALFFRKLYHLASVRLRDLFEKLGIDDSDLLKKIWTCFEHALVNHSHLMCDRHLDQLIMCSMYLIAKVTEKPLTFQNIMKCYRLQPQAQSHVYRSVLLLGRHRHGSGSSDGSNRSNGGSGTCSPVNVDNTGKDKKRGAAAATAGGGGAVAAAGGTDQPTVRSSSTLPHPRPNSQPPTPTRFGGGGVNFDFEEERGDLITFYNMVYLKKIRSFALRFSEKEELPNTPKLSPLPAVRCLQASPRRVSNSHSLFISPHLANRTAPSSRGMSYSINHSPSKDLQAINKMIKQNMLMSKGSSKRVLEVDVEESALPPAKRLALGHPLIQRLQDLGSSMDKS